MYVSLLCENVFLLGYRYLFVTAAVYFFPVPDGFRYLFVVFCTFPLFDFPHMYTCSNLYNTRKRGARGKPSTVKSTARP